MTVTNNTLLVEHALAALKRAYAPFSKFSVGAALEAANGKIYTGCNIEVSSYGLTMCAERVAFFKAVSEGEYEFSRIAITADIAQFCPPCGACRQVISDFAPDIKIVLINNAGKTRETTIQELLPEAFSKDFLQHSDK